MAGVGHATIKQVEERMLKIKGKINTNVQIENQRINYDFS